jgi:regulator of sirC expression with transglutaminase-like and TPR domain
MFIRRILLASFIVAATVIMLVGGSSWADASGVNPELYGTWDAVEAKTVGMTGRVTFTITENEVINTCTCSFPGYQVSVQVASPAVITASEIRTLESRSEMKEYRPGFLQCRASVKKGTMYYQLIDGKLILAESPTGEALALSRSGGKFRAAVPYKKPTGSKLALTHTNRGTAYLRKGQYDAAIGEYNKALQINPRSAVAYYNRSVAYTSKGQYDKAVTDCSSALQLNPSDAKSYYSRGVSHWHLGSKNKAIKDLQSAAKLQHKGAQDFLASMGVKW